MPEEPTNAQLQETIRKQEETIREHTLEDGKQFKGIKEQLVEIAASQVTKKDLENLAKSVRGVVHLQKNLILAGDIVSKSGKWGYRAILVIASLITALGIIFGGWKPMVAWFLGKSI